MKLKSLVIISLILVINILFFSINNVQAADSISDAITGGDGFIQAGKKENTIINQTELKNTSDMIYNTLLLLGMSIAVIIAGILGIKFMIGSVEEKAQIKDALVPFIIGCIVVFGAFGIWKIFVSIGNNL